MREFFQICISSCSAEWNSFSTAMFLALVTINNQLTINVRVYFWTVNIFLWIDIYLYASITLISTVVLKSRNEFVNFGIHQDFYFRVPCIWILGPALSISAEKKNSRDFYRIGLNLEVNLQSIIFLVHMCYHNRRPKTG